MSDNFYIGAYWGTRAESVEQCARRAASFLDCLARIDPVFGRWFQRGWSREEARQRAVAADADALQTLLLEGRSRTDRGDRAMESLGFHLGLWTGDSDGRSAGLDVRCGSDAPVPGVNSCVLNLPDDEALADRLLRVPTLASLVECMAGAWNPDWAVVNSLDFLDRSEAPADNAPRMGWMIYISARRGAVPPLPAPAQVLSVGEHGALVVITPDRFEATNAVHAEAARRVAQTLGQAALLGPLRP